MPLNYTKQILALWAENVNKLEYYGPFVYNHLTFMYY